MLNNVLSWLLVSKIPQDEYTFRYSKNQDSKEGKEILNPGYSFSIISKWEGQICLWPQSVKSRWKILWYESKKSFPDFLTNAVSFWFVCFGNFFFLMWPALETLYAWAQNHTSQRQDNESQHFHQAEEIKSKEELVNTVTGVLTWISPQSSTSSKSEFHLSGC